MSSLSNRQFVAVMSALKDRRVGAIELQRRVTAYHRAERRQRILSTIGKLLPHLAFWGFWAVLIF